MPALVCLRTKSERREMRHDYAGVRLAKIGF
jgi:hypothetical protein